MSAILAALINAGIAGSALTLAVWLILRVAPRRALNAATRYAIWWTTLLVVVTLPLFYLPRQAEPVVVAVPVSAPLEAVEATAAPASQSESMVVETSASPRWPQFPLELSFGAWPARILELWMFASTLMMLRLCASYILLERRKRRAASLERFQHWPIRALVSRDIASPMAAGLFRPAILLPERLLAKLTDEELEQIRVHETAHLLRHDDVALLVQRTLEAIFALHPLVRWITRRIDLEREIACDDFVVEQTGQARPYASCLTRVVEIAGGVRSSIVAAAATEERSHLARRIEMLLDKTRHTGTRLLKIQLLIVTAAVLALALAIVNTPGLVAFAAAQEDLVDAQAPPPPVPPAPVPSVSAPAAPELPSTPELPAAPAAPSMPLSPPEPDQNSMEVSNRTVTWQTSEGLHKRRLQIHGDVYFNDDETDVKAISAGGSFSYEESYGFTNRIYRATSDGAGRIVRHYLVDSREKSFDGDAQAWLRAALPDLLRETGIDAPERVRRILKQGGAPAVLAEIAKIHSDGTKRLYIRELVPAGNLNPDQFQSILRMVRGMGSDGEKAALLVFLAPNTLKDNLRDYAFEALKTVHSDGEKHRVLTQFILQDASRNNLAMSARASQDISSDGEKAAVLLDLASHLRGNADLSHPFFRAAESIHSDGERARVLIAVIASVGEQHDMLSEALRVAQSMSSDGEKARVLVDADAYWKDDDLVRRAFFETARTIHSDGEKAHVLTSLIAHGGLSDTTLIETVRCAARISSDGEKARVLVAVASHSTGKSSVRDEIKTAASSIHSDGEYRRVMNAIDLRAGSIPNRPQTR
jgi:beta-lactamase regulating signal transducer with metallopeptidase domain